MSKSIKEELFGTMQRMAAEMHEKSTTLIVFSECEYNSLQSMVGYNNEYGIGTLFHIHATKELINTVLSIAWSATDTQQNYDESKFE